MRLSNIIILIENCNVFTKEEFLGIFGQLFKGEQEINSTHTARQAKSRDIDSKRPNIISCEIHVLICVKSKHGCSSGMMSWIILVIYEKNCVIVCIQVVEQFSFIRLSIVGFESKRLNQFINSLHSKRIFSVYRKISLFIKKNSLVRTLLAHYLALGSACYDLNILYYRAIFVGFILYILLIYRYLISISLYQQLLFSFCIDQKRFLYPDEEISLYIKLSMGVQHIIYQHIQLSLDLFIMKKRRKIMGSSISVWLRIIGFPLLVGHLQQYFIVSAIS